MVTTGSGSRPAQLTQAQVDDLVRGSHEPISGVRRTASPEPSMAAKDVDVRGGRSRPADISPKDIDAIRRTGRPPAATAKRLAAAARVEPDRAPRAGAKSAKRVGSAPTTTPPGLA